MKNYTKYSSLDQMIQSFQNRINELSGSQGDVDSSFDYPDDLVDLENGEYESHATEPVNASVDGPTQEVLNFLASKGYDTSDKSVINYADAVAEYMDMSRQAYEREGMESPYSLDQWYEDTMMNYPQELEDLPMVEGCQDVMSASYSNGYSDPISMLNMLTSDLEDEFGLEFSNPNYDSAEPSIEFMYGIPDWGDCAFYTDDQSDPEIFEAINSGDLDEAYQLLRDAIIENYENDYGPLGDY